MSCCGVSRGGVWRFVCRRCGSGCRGCLLRGSGLALLLRLGPGRGHLMFLHGGTLRLCALLRLGTLLRLCALLRLGFVRRGYMLLRRRGGALGGRRSGLTYSCPFV